MHDWCTDNTAGTLQYPLVWLVLFCIESSSTFVATGILVVSMIDRSPNVLHKRNADVALSFGFALLLLADGWGASFNQDSCR